jgi:hypothetical protein
MSETFTTGSGPTRRAYLRVHPEMLRKMLRLPADVEIVDVGFHRSFEIQPDEIQIEVRGGSLPVPADGKTHEVDADYEFEHLTHIRFKGFRAP